MCLKCLIHIHEMFLEDHHCVLISIERIDNLGEYFLLKILTSQPNEGKIMCAIWIRAPMVLFEQYDVNNNIEYHKFSPNIKN